MSYQLVVKDAFWQILGKIISAIVGFFVVKLITPYLGPLRYGDYSTTLNYFVLWTAFADFGLYVISLKDLGKLNHDAGGNGDLSYRYSQYVWSRFFMIGLVYLLAMIVAYMLPSYTSNVYLLRGLPLGMVYSATALGSSMFRLPLQLFWGMKHVSIALFLARIVQILVLVLIIYVRAPLDTFDASALPVALFLAVLGSVVMSALVEGGYTYVIANKYLKIVRVPFIGFLKEFLTHNRKYGLSQFMSGLYIPLMLIIISVFYATVEGYSYVGYWGLALSLIGMLLIIPSSLGNSMLHKVSASSVEVQRKNFGSFFLLMLWIGLLITVNFLIFAQPLIYFISGPDYISAFGLSTYDTIGYVLTHGLSVDQDLLGADFLLPFFGLILLVSFVKNMYSYLFVGTHNHNVLFQVNVVAVAVGLVAGIVLVFYGGLLGALVAQLLFGLTFLLGFAFESARKSIVPIFSKRDFGRVLSFFALVFVGGYFVNLGVEDFARFIIYATILNGFCLAIWYKWLKRVARGLV